MVTDIIDESLSPEENIRSIYVDYLKKSSLYLSNYHYSEQKELLVLNSQNRINYQKTNFKNMEAVYKNILHTKKKLEKNNKKATDSAAEKAYTDLYSEFEIYIHNILEYVYKINKELILKNLKGESSIYGITDEKIDEIVTKIIKSNSIVQVLKKLYKENNIEYNNYISKEEEKALFKISAKRNIIIHNDGIVNSEYIKVFTRNNIELDYNEGDRITKGMESKEISNLDTLISNIGQKVCDALISKYGNIKNS